MVRLVGKRCSIHVDLSLGLAYGMQMDGSGWGKNSSTRD